MFRSKYIEVSSGFWQFAILAPLPVLVLAGGCSIPTIQPTEFGVNIAPIAEAGPNIAASIGQTVELDGGASSDQDGDPLSYLWAQTAGPSVDFSGQSSRNLTFSLSQAGVYEFALTVADGNGGSDIDSIVVTVESGEDLPVTGMPVPPEDPPVPPTDDPVTPDDDTAAWTWDFDSGTEDWTLTGGAFVDATLPGWSGGSRRISGSGPGQWYFSSPLEFSGDQLNVYGYRLQFRLNRDTSCRDRSSEVWEGIVVLSGGGWTIGWGAINGTQHDFNGPMSVRLDEGDAWFIVNSADAALQRGTRATGGVFQEILGNLSELRIFGQRGACNGISTLDDVRITQ